MKSLLNNLKALITSTNDKKTLITCNYEDNYYGDQKCQSVQLKKRDLKFKI